MEVLRFSCARPAVSNQLHLKTICALRGALKNADQDAMLLLEIISYMCLTEIFRLDFTAARMHLGAVEKLLELVGGINKVVNYASEMFVFADYFLALSTLSRPILGSRMSFRDGPPVPVNMGLEDSEYLVQNSHWYREASAYHFTPSCPTVDLSYPNTVLFLVAPKAGGEWILGAEEVCIHHHLSAQCLAA